jgi:hypothetical protein
LLHARQESRVVFWAGFQEKEAGGLILAAYASMVEEVADERRERAVDQGLGSRSD